MNKVTLKEANQNFSRLARMVDEEGQIAITRHGEEEYYLIRREVYEGRSIEDMKLMNEAKKGFWVDVTKQLGQGNGKAICKVKSDKDEVNITLIHFEEANAEANTAAYIQIPKDNVEITKEETVNIHISDPRGMKYIGIDIKDKAPNARTKAVQDRAKETIREYTRENPEIYDGNISGGLFGGK